ncbi:hypothetical protein ACLB2K_001710 [Fragaria x ananassa]
MERERLEKLKQKARERESLTNLESLNIKWCNSISDADMKPLSGLTNLKCLQISCSKVTDSGITYLKESGTM